MYKFILPKGNEIFSAFLDELDPTVLQSFAEANFMKIYDIDRTINILNAVVDIIIETGNFSLEQEQFHFDICNFDSVTDMSSELKKS